MSMTEEMNWSPESDFVTEMSDGGVCIVKYTGPGGEVRIPPTLGGSAVVEIGSDAFRGCKGLTGVSIPEGVAEIGWRAFKGCRNLKNVTIPHSLTRIGAYAFDGCRALGDVDIPSLMEYVGKSAFRDCPAGEHLCYAFSLVDITA